MNIDKLKRTPEMAASLAAMISGILTHAYALANNLHNYDNILQQPWGVGAGVKSGRWLLDIIGEVGNSLFDLNYNLPLVNGLLYLVMIALSAGLVVHVLKIQNRVFAAFAGCLMATFPTVCATMVFRYTAPHYGVALFLSILAVWTINISKWGMILSALSLACSMGIYQAYAPVTIGLFVLLLLRESLEENVHLSVLIKRGFFFCSALLIGVLLYFAFQKIFTVVYTHFEGPFVLNDYQGISSMGKISLERLPRLIRRAFTFAAFFPLRNYCTLAATAILKVLWCVLILTIVLLAGYLLLSRKIRPLQMAFCCLMGLLFPIAVNFLMIMCPDSHIYTIMVYAFVLIACAPLMLLELLPQRTESGINKLFVRLISVLLAGIVFYNSYYTNYNYTALDYANRQVENYLSGLITQIRMTKGYRPDMKWAFLGEIDDPNFYNIWDEDLFYGGISGSTASGLLNVSYSFDFWIYSFIGYGAPHATAEEEAALIGNPFVTLMPCWPSEGSIQVVDDFLVVKFQDAEALR